MSHPDFIIIGAMKCGTSTLQAQLKAQPGIFMSDPKEPNFFSDDDVFARGLDWYQSLFTAAAPGDLTGEASTHYTKLPTYPDTVKRLRSSVASIRLIYLVRDPVERAISHYIHEWSLGRMDGDLAANFERHPEMVEYSRYGRQLLPFIRVFGAGNIHLCSLESLKSSPQDELEGICHFLGYERRPEWRSDLQAQNVSSERIVQFPLRRVLVDNALARAVRRNVIPQSTRDLVKRRFTMQERPKMPADLRETLEGEFLKDREILAQHFPDHPSLTASYPFAAR